MAVLRVTVMGHEFERTIAVADDHSHTAILGNDLIEDLKTYTKTWLDPPKAFSDLNAII